MHGILHVVLLTLCSLFWFVVWALRIDINIAWVYPIMLLMGWSTVSLVVLLK